MWRGNAAAGRNIPAHDRRCGMYGKKRLQFALLLHKLQPVFECAQNRNSTALIFSTWFPHPSLDDCCSHRLKRFAGSVRFADSSGPGGSFDRPSQSAPSGPQVRPVIMSRNEGGATGVDCRRVFDLHAGFSNICKRGRAGVVSFTRRWFWLLMKDGLSAAAHEDICHAGRCFFAQHSPIRLSRARVKKSGWPASQPEYSWWHDEKIEVH